MTEMKEKVIVFIISIFICYLLYLLVNVNHGLDEFLDKINKMNDLCQSH